ncbi:MAG TPA: hypothetical protein VFN35_13180, partial [Ktedonobacteraceae bacterium]|nr:hypothetical protein [Ktedonobacteraceae bacterium]
TLDAVRAVLGTIFRSARLDEDAIVGIEGGRTPIIPAYTQVGVTGPETHELLHLLILGANCAMPPYSLTNSLPSKLRRRLLRSGVVKPLPVRDMPPHALLFIKGQPRPR